MTGLVMVIGQMSCDTSQGPLAVGEYMRLPLEEAVKLVNLSRATLADFKEQDLPDPLPHRGRYQRRDLRAED